MADKYDEPSVEEGFEDIEAAADAAITEDDDGTQSVDAVAAVEPSPIYGGEGFGTVRRRHLLVLTPLTNRDDLLPADRALLLEADIREAMALAARKLDNAAAKYAVTGYDWNLDDIEYDMPRPRVLSATLVLERE